MDGKLFIVEYIFIELVSHTIWKVLYTLCLSKALPTNILFTIHQYLGHTAVLRARLLLREEW